MVNLSLKLLSYFLLLFFLTNSELFAQVGSYEAHVGFVYHGPIYTKGELESQGGVVGYKRTRPNHLDPIHIDSFRVLIMHGDSVLSVFSNKGIHFTREIKSAFKAITGLDKVIIFDIS